MHNHDFCQHSKKFKTFSTIAYHLFLFISASHTITNNPQKPKRVSARRAGHRHVYSSTPLLFLSHLSQNRSGTSVGVSFLESIHIIMIRSRATSVLRTMMTTKHVPQRQLAIMPTVKVATDTSTMEFPAPSHVSISSEAADLAKQLSDFYSNPGMF